MSNLFYGAINSIEKLNKQRTITLCILLALIVLVIDYITGKSVEFPILYGLPVGIAAWRSQKNTAITLAIFLPLVRVGFHFPWQETQSIALAVLNALIVVMVLILYTYLVDRVAWQTSALEKKVRILEGILPICASCKRIRNENGEYEQIEEYITERTEASFSHGICQECSKKLYPEYFKDVNG